MALIRSSGPLVGDQLQQSVNRLHRRPDLVAHRRQEIRFHLRHRVGLFDGGDQLFLMLLGRGNIRAPQHKRFLAIPSAFGNHEAHPALAAFINPAGGHDISLWRGYAFQLFEENRGL
jgi:hypothetical protein